MCFAIGSLVFCVSGFETSSGGSSRIRFACMVFPIVICRAGESTISRRPALYRSEERRVGKRLEEYFCPTAHDGRKFASLSRSVAWGARSIHSGNDGKAKDRYEVGKNSMDCRLLRTGVAGGQGGRRGLARQQDSPNDRFESFRSERWSLLGRGGRCQNRPVQSCLARRKFYASFRQRAVTAKRLAARRAQCAGRAIVPRRNPLG